MVVVGLSRFDSGDGCVVAAAVPAGSADAVGDSDRSTGRIGTGSHVVVAAAFVAVGVDVVELEVAVVGYG